MSEYLFQVINQENRSKISEDWFRTRPLINYSDTLEKGAKYFIPGKDLEMSINVAIATGIPLLITGESGTGKTQVAYYIAEKLKLPLYHFAVKSTSKAQDLLYDFDTVRYFYDAYLPRSNGAKVEEVKQLDKNFYISQGPLWKAIDSDKPMVLLIDEIDKASRDFPNDLLHEIDQMKIYIKEINKTIEFSEERRKNKPIVVVTSNSERRLPEPFLRRCIYHFIEFNQEILEKAVYARKHEYENLSPEFIKFAITNFISLRNKNMRKLPSTSELIIWLRVIAIAVKAGTFDAGAIMNLQLEKIPLLGSLIKDSQDIKELKEDTDGMV